MSTKSSKDSPSNKYDSEINNLYTENSEKYEGHRYNINLIFIGVVLFFLYNKAGTLFPLVEFSKTSLMSKLNNILPDFKLNKKINKQPKIQPNTQLSTQSSTQSSTQLNTQLNIQPNTQLSTQPNTQLIK
jgi:hypothetical protein